MSIKFKVSFALCSEILLMRIQFIFVFNSNTPATTGTTVCLNAIFWWFLFRGLYIWEVYQIVSLKCFLFVVFFFLTRLHNHIKIIVFVLKSILTINIWPISASIVSVFIANFQNKLTASPNKTWFLSTKVRLHNQSKKSVILWIVMITLWMKR